MITVITGVGTGIGGAAARALAERGHQVVLVGRTPAKVAAVAAGLAGTGRPPLTLTCDYTRLDDVRKLAAEIRERVDRIDVLVNNAGVMTTRRTLTPDGHETMIQVNHLAPFLLTTLLLDHLADGGRVITTTSRAAKTGHLDLADLDRERRRWSGWLQYGDTKQANILFTVALARRGVAATCFHPGVIKTEFASGTFFMKVVHNLPGYGKSPEEGAKTLVHLATTEDGKTGKGHYFTKCRQAPLPARLTDPTLAESLWQTSTTLTRP
ncbi:NAD(P)-dependent dehydrogenase (short-subunit alcohol dehydrogenase family) [Thermocatellispora tengchongensis]|uniref:NAD(P)-dependent dehydrogenase (Short-subunit alcohol dehydrogenase family) n=1 Tax=Thermocatellispora tengchongensis TaxID=1073253 RepID=A0A840NTI1_9ACTN|nr:SDR family NAD(P)-dependent oxidoreductase [Thermocatellispora tengchongensis]MBB5130888.1 NAD(P)-dependent dehydrogenase (short-subunit alcohol dehydrogenase family) [Thermocatellispora tengchongensis]